jgi:hypothetical protein
LINSDLTLNKTFSSLSDYKFYCFDGEVKVVVISTGRFQNLCFDYFDTEFNHLPFEQGGPNSPYKIAKPPHFDEMLDVASKLSKGIPHVRVDLYNVNGKIYFGELTFFDSSGMTPFYPLEWDTTFGSWLNIKK